MSESVKLIVPKRPQDRPAKQGEIFRRKDTDNYYIVSRIPETGIALVNLEHGTVFSDNNLWGSVGREGFEFIAPHIEIERK